MLSQCDVTFAGKNQVENKLSWPCKGAIVVVIVW